MSPIRSDAVAGIPQARNRGRRIPSEKWEKKRPLITTLYQAQGQTLNEVMQILKKDDWDPTMKMYKSRISKWGLKKKLKSHKVLATLPLKQERDGQQKPSQFTIRGQPVSMDRIDRHIEGNAGVLSRVRAGQRPGVQSSQEVACYTPPPGPTDDVTTPTRTTSNLPGADASVAALDGEQSHVYSTSLAGSDVVARRRPDTAMPLALNGSTFSTSSSSTRIVNRPTVNFIPEDGSMYKSLAGQRGKTKVTRLRGCVSRQTRNQSPYNWCKSGRIRCEKPSGGKHGRPCEVTASATPTPNNVPAQVRASPPATIEQEPLANPAADNNLEPQTMMLGLPSMSPASAPPPVPWSPDHPPSHTLPQKHQSNGIYHESHGQGGYQLCAASSRNSHSRNNTPNPPNYSSETDIYYISQSQEPTAPFPGPEYDSSDPLTSFFIPDRPAGWLSVLCQDWLPQAWPDGPSMPDEVSWVSWGSVDPPGLTQFYPSSSYAYVPYDAFHGSPSYGA